jgi:hypothetical protein
VRTLLAATVTEESDFQKLPQKERKEHIGPVPLISRVLIVTG